MNFTEFEKIMNQNGIKSLAEIARVLKTTPQAVSNWKARDQVPYHIISKIKNKITTEAPEQKINYAQAIETKNLASAFEDEIVFSDVLIKLAEQLKVILLVIFISLFTTFTYVQFIQTPKYQSVAKILLPDNNQNLGGINGFASQFGVNMPQRAQTDLSSPTLLPEILSSRTFAEKILLKKFYTKKLGKELTLLEIITDSEKIRNIDQEALISTSKNHLEKMLILEQKSGESFSLLKVIGHEPLFTKQLAQKVLKELELLNRYFKNISVTQKINFIEKRIASVEYDLKKSEKLFKEFNEQNRQISSPSLQLEQDRLAREVEIQKGVFLTLKQQLELSKIEEVQESSILQVLDYPQLPISAFNRNLAKKMLLALVFGAVVGIILAFIRSYLNNSNIDERKKIRRIKAFIKKKSIDLVFDKRVSGLLSIIFLSCLPIYLGHESKNPIYFNRYSQLALLVNIIYVLTTILIITIFFRLYKKESRRNN